MQEKIKKEFIKHLVETTNNILVYPISFGLIILIYFMISDLYIRHNIYAFYTRLLPFFATVFLLIFHLFNKEKYKRQKFIFYNFVMVCLMIMMYMKYIVYINYTGQAYSSTGIILILFLVSLEIKLNTLNTILVYLLPVIGFILAIVFFYDLPKQKIVDISNIFPMMILGFAINRLQYRLRYKLFKSNYFLNIEKQKTKELYEDSIITNKILSQQNEEIRAQNELINDKNKELYESNVTKNKLFSIISHDLRSPFYALLGFSKMLINRYDSLNISKQKLYISYIYQNINSTYKLLENLLLWSQTQNDTIEYNPQIENVYDLVNETENMLSQILNAKNISFKQNIYRDIFIKADKDMILTILRNLISNAVKFTDKNGQITVTAFPSTQKHNFIDISVIDTGVGIPKEIQPKLFDITNNISTKGTEEEKGSGLGLTLCKEFVEKHNGTITVESNLGQGSKFTFTIPAA